MGANLLRAYIGHEGISFPSPHFLDFVIPQFGNSVVMPV